MKNLLISIFTIALLSLTVTSGVASAALRDACAETRTANSALCTDSKAASDPTAPNPISGPNGIIIKITRIIALIAGAAAIIILLIASIQYVTSSGDSNNVKKARETILYCLIGIVVIALAQTIIQFVVNRI